MKATRAQAARPRVLAVDANPVFRASVAGFLHRRGVDVAGVASGEEALRALESVEPSLCVIDLSPAGRMGGLQLAQALHERDPALRFVFLSAWLEPSFSERPPFLESAPLLRKPVDLDELSAVIWRVLTQAALEEDPCRMP